MLITNRHQSTVSASPRQPDRPSSLWRVGLLAIAGSVMVNWLVDSVLVAVLPISPDFSDLEILKVEPFTIVGALGAVLVFGIVQRFSRRPNAVYTRIASLVLLLSAIPDLGMLSTPGATPIAVGALFFLHVTTYLVCVGVLTNCMGNCPDWRRWSWR